jgi:hypothetical protein
MAPKNDDPFKAGSSGGSGITEYDGQLLLVTPTEYIASMKTVHGQRDAIRADVAVLDGPNGIEEIEDTLIFAAVIISGMKRQAKFNEANDVDPSTGFPKMTLGVLFQDESQKKQGQSAPWVLGEPDDAQAQLARDYLAGKKSEPADPFAKA